MATSLARQPPPFACAPPQSMPLRTPLVVEMLDKDPIVMSVQVRATAQ